MWISAESPFPFQSDNLIGSPRIEYHCKKCGGHHGHIFDDGPKPSGKRYCNNGLCLVFVPKKYLQDADYLKIMNKIKGRVQRSY